MKTLISVSAIAPLLCGLCLAQASQSAAADPAGQVTWAGTVSDDQGRAVTGAEVFVIADYFGERRASKHLLSAVSDAQGAWRAALTIAADEFKVQACRNVYLITHRSGRSCDVLYFPYLHHDDSKNPAQQPNPRELKLVVSSAKATLSVKAMRDNAPLASAVVRIANEQWPQIYPGSIQNSDDPGARERLEKLLHPVAQTDDHGVATLDGLAPGTYRILAAARDSAQLHRFQVDPRQRMSAPVYAGVPLRGGEHRHYSVAVYEQRNRAYFQILQGDGEPASSETTVYEYYHGAGFVDGASGSGSWIDKKGGAQFDFGRPGLWRMYAREREFSWLTRADPPCNESAGVVAVSPLLDDLPAAVLRARFVERKEWSRPSRVAPLRNVGLVVDTGGRVFHTDGKTPAFRAKLVTVEPKSARVIHDAHSDALGRFQTKTYSVAGEQPGASPGPWMLATLPGECGATILPLPATTPMQKLSITLPKAMSLRGRVTVGGKSTAEWDNQFRVLAAHEGRGALDELLSVQVSADKDGRFELAGLTRGRYRVQASMDDIWLSSSVPLTVDTDGVRAESLKLDIGRPGRPSIVRCTDRNGKPIVGMQVELDRPAGPLTKLLWPATFTSDGAGVVNLPPLEAGDHVLRVPSVRDPTKRAEHRFTVDALKNPPRPIVFDLVID
jgi:hypothetical protein